MPSRETNSNLLVIVPAFNEQDCIGEVLSQIPNWVDVVVINDGSSDNTKEICLLHDKLVLSHEVNKGYEEALITGVGFFMSSSYTQFVVIDADGEIDVANALALLSAVSKEQPLFCGYRTAYKGRVAERIVGRITDRFFGVKDLYCGCKGFHRSIVVEHTPEQICDGIFTKFVLKKSLVSNIVNVPIGGIARKGTSRFGSGITINLRLFGNFILSVITLITERKLNQ